MWLLILFPYMGCKQITQNYFKYLLFINKNLCAKATGYIPKCYDRLVIRKPILNFIRVNKNYYFDQSFVYI